MDLMEPVAFIFITHQLFPHSSPMHQPFLHHLDQVPADLDTIFILAIHKFIDQEFSLLVLQPEFPII